MRYPVASSLASPARSSVASSPFVGLSNLGLFAPVLEVALVLVSEPVLFLVLVGVPSTLLCLARTCLFWYVSGLARHCAGLVQSALTVEAAGTKAALVVRIICYLAVQVWDLAVQELVVGTAELEAELVSDTS